MYKHFKGLEKKVAFFQNTLPHLSMGWVWYCSSAPLDHTTCGHVWQQFLEESSHFPNPWQPIWGLNLELICCLHCLQYISPPWLILTVKLHTKISVFLWFPDSSSLAKASAQWSTLPWFCCSVVLCLHLSLTSFLHRNSVAWWSIVTSKGMFLSVVFLAIQGRCHPSWNIVL